MLYNSTEFDQIASIMVVWSNDIPPQIIDLPGTTGNSGPATMLFVSGSDTDFVTLSLGATSTASIQAVIFSLSMPTNSEGITNKPLPVDGNLYPFQKLTRYYAVLPEGWCELSLVSKKTQFISIQICCNTATVIVLNKGSGLYKGQIQKLGAIAQKEGTVSVIEWPKQTYTDPDIKGDGASRVWVCADSKANSEDAKIALQTLSAMLG
ncbi:MAG: hypothetical protein KTR19_00325 [Hyphomicrobiales bacterium]|nr:hypothetical protein [Hyphomicrobiales bacterium]